MIRTPPLPLRNRLAGTVLAAVAGAAARGQLRALAEGDPAAAGWADLEPGVHADLVRARAAAALRALADRAPGPPASLDELLEVAGRLFDAGLGFEVHELLEARWSAAAGEEREALQGLIQVAVGYQHLANGNRAGARALIEEGAGRLRGRRLGGRDLDSFAAAARASLAAPPPAAGPPSFPRADPRPPRPQAP